MAKSHPRGIILALVFFVLLLTIGCATPRAYIGVELDEFNLVKNESLLATVRISCSRSPASFSTNLDSNLREILSKEGKFSSLVLSTQSLVLVR